MARKHMQSYTPSNTNGVIALMQDGAHMLIEDFDVILLGLQQILSLSNNALVVTHINPNLPQAPAYLLIIACINPIPQTTESTVTSS